MPKPLPYVVSYEDPELVRRELERAGAVEHMDPTRTENSQGFASLAAARRFAKGLPSYWQIRRRINIHDYTPAGDPPGLLWDWEEEFVEDQGSQAGPLKGERKG